MSCVNCETLQWCIEFYSDLNAIDTAQAYRKALTHHKTEKHNP